MSFGIPVRNGVMLGLTASTALSTRGGYRAPAMSLNFLQPFLDSRITFSRGTGATRVNASGFIETVGNTTPRFDYDPVTLAPRGLLIEEARTNLALRSEELNDAAWTAVNVTVTANSTAAPSGVTAADTVAANASGAGSRAQQDITVPTTSQYVYSCYLKAGTANTAVLRLFNNTAATNLAEVTFNLLTGIVSATAAGSGTITPAGNGWYRCVVTHSGTATATNSLRCYVYPNNTNPNSGDAVFAWGAQLEAGSFATSYIPTVASTVTRNADVATMTGTNFSSWYNQSEGTFVTVGDYVSRTNFRIFMAADNTPTLTSRIMINGDQTQQLVVTDSGSTVVNLTAGTAPEANIPTRIAAAYLLNDFAVTRDGGTVATDNTGTAPALNRLVIGYYPNGALYLNGHIRTIAYFNTRLPNAQLQTLTAPSLATTLSLDFTSGSYNVGF